MNIWTVRDQLHCYSQKFPLVTMAGTQDYAIYRVGWHALQTSRKCLSDSIINVE